MKVKYEYCPQCGTIQKVIWVGKSGDSMAFPKECRCKAEAFGDEWIPDDELKSGIEEAEIEDEGVKTMNEKARAARNAYRRDWVKRNPEKVKAIQERYWTKKAEYEELPKAAEPQTAKGQQKAASPEEAKMRASQMRTQGRKGCKAVRINMALTPENHDFVTIAARASGQNMTKFVNFIIEKFRLEHQDAYKQAKQFIESIKG